MDLPPLSPYRLHLSLYLHPQRLQM